MSKLNDEVEKKEKQMKLKLFRGIQPIDTHTHTHISDITTKGKWLYTHAETGRNKHKG